MQLHKNGLLSLRIINIRQSYVTVPCIEMLYNVSTVIEFFFGLLREIQSIIVRFYNAV